MIRSPRSRRFQQLGRIVLTNVVGALLLGWFFSHFDGAGFLRALQRFSPGATGAVLLMAFLTMSLQGLRFYFLLPAGLTPLRHLLLSYALCTGNILLPFRGGELVRPIYIRRWRPEVPLRSLIAVSVLDRLIEVAALLPVVALAGVLLVDLGHFRAAGRWALLVLAVLAVLAVGLYLTRARWRRIVELPEELMQRPRRLLWAFLCSLGVWVVSYLLFYAAVPQPRLALALLLGVNVSMALPSLPAGIGAYEASFLWVGQRGGLAAEPLMVAAVASHALQILLTLILGVPLLWRWGWPRADDAPARGATPAAAPPP